MMIKRTLFINKNEIRACYWGGSYEQLYNKEQQCKIDVSAEEFFLWMVIAYQFCNLENKNSISILNFCH